MSRTTIAQLEAVVINLTNAYAIQAGALADAVEKIKSIELQLAHLQLNQPKPTAIPQVEYVDPCSRVQNWKMEYAKYRAVTGNTPTADGVRAWIRAGRPE